MQELEASLSYREWIEWLEHWRLDNEEREQAKNPKPTWQALQASLMQHSLVVKNRGGH